MSTTRHADSEAPLSQERYMSSPEYRELRGISGNAVTAKADFVQHPAKRSLLFFLQAMSLAEGGLRKFCADFLAMFPDRIGTPSMHQGKIRAGKYDEMITSLIEEEMFGLERSAHRAMMSISHIKIDGPPCDRAHWLDECQQAAQGLDRFIIELCVNPKLCFSAPGEQPEAREHEQAETLAAFQGRIKERDFSAASVPWFKDIIGALWEFKRNFERAAEADFVMTTAARQVFDTLDVALETGKMVVVEGGSGIGKTTATKAWCQQHLGEARFVTISGCSNKTSVFRSIAKALGLASSYARTATEMQARIEDVLQRARLVLVLDEAHHLFSAAERVYTRPELVDWIDTSIYNQGIPCALICTPQFAVRMDRVERQTTWNADQFRRRVKRYKQLPAAPKTDDLLAVAKKLLPGADGMTIKHAAGFGISAKRHLSGVVDLVDEARGIARRAGRDRITFEDVEKAGLELCGPSYEAMARTFALPARGRPRRPVAPSPALAEPEETLTPSGRPEAPERGTSRQTNLTGLKPAPISASRRHVAPLVQDSCTALAEA